MKLSNKEQLQQDITDWQKSAVMWKDNTFTLTKMCLELCERVEQLEQKQDHPETTCRSGDIRCNYCEGAIYNSNGVLTCDTCSTPFNLVKDEAIPGLIPTHRTACAKHGDIQGDRCLGCFHNEIVREEHNNNQQIIKELGKVFDREHNMDTHLWSSQRGAEVVSPAPDMSNAYAPHKQRQQRQQPQEFLMDEQQVAALAQRLGATVNGIAPQTTSPAMQAELAPRGADYYMFNRGMLHAIELLEKAEKPHRGTSFHHAGSDQILFGEGVAFAIEVLRNAMKEQK